MAPNGILRVLLVHTVVIRPTPLARRPSRLFQTNNNCLATVRRVVDLCRATGFLILDLGGGFYFPSEGNGSSGIVQLKELSLFTGMVGPFGGQVRFSVFIGLIMPRY